MILYNDNEPSACAWLRQLIAEGLLAEGEVDGRPIQEISAADCAGRTRCHFFAGIGGWEYALQLAGWPADRVIWSGSCPCQPFSAAGKRKGQADERHLWPVFLRLIRECRPATVVGEQVASDDGYRWLARVRDDLEEAGYAVGCADLPACCQGAPHIRQRLFWVADLQGERQRQGSPLPQGSGEGVAAQGAGLGPADDCGSRRLDDASGPRRPPSGSGQPGEPQGRQCLPGLGCAARGVFHPASPGRGEGRGQGRSAEPAGGVGHGGSDGRQQGPEVLRGREPQPAGDGFWSGGVADAQHCGGRLNESERGPEGRVADRRSGFWADAPSILCGDGKTRRIPAEPSLFPLAHGVPGRVGLLRGAGNAISPQAAAHFLRAFLETEGGLT